MLIAVTSSRRRTAARSATISGRSIAGLRMSPRSPPVHVTTRTSTPSSAYLAIVAAPLLDSSSGWACTAISRSRSPSGPNAGIRTSRGRFRSPPLCSDTATAMTETDGKPRRDPAKYVAIAIGVVVAAVGVTVTFLPRQAPDISYHVVSVQLGDPAQVFVTFEVEKAPLASAECQVTATGHNREI